MWKSKFHNFFLGVQNNPNSFLNLRHLYWNILIISLSDKFTGFENEWTFEKSDSNHLRIFIIYFSIFSGDWIAFGCSELGQLLVWEWQSETYVLKQQGHFNNMASVSFSPDGTVMATGGHDGKVKLWATTSGFCFVTFAEHTAAVSAVKYSIGKHISRSFFFFKLVLLEREGKYLRVSTLG